MNLDSCSFHSCVGLQEFDDTRLLTIRPPEGEVYHVNYCFIYDIHNSKHFHFIVTRLSILFQIILDNAET